MYTWHGPTSTLSYVPLCSPFQSVPVDDYFPSDAASAAVPSLVLSQTRSGVGDTSRRRTFGGDTTTRTPTKNGEENGGGWFTPFARRSSRVSFSCILFVCMHEVPYVLRIPVLQSKSPHFVWSYRHCRLLFVRHCQEGTVEAVH